MDNISLLCKAIKAEMKRRDLSPQDLATLAGVSFSAIYRWFNGENAPNTDTITKLLDALKLRLSVTSR